MFVVKSLFGKIMGNETNPELIQLQSGQLNLVRPNSIKGSRECIYKDAVATVRRTTKEFNYQLVVTRAYEEGEEELLDEDEETDDERVFLIDPTLKFHDAQHEGQEAFRWDELNGDDGDTWEFVVDSNVVNAPTCSLFHLTVLQCMYERVHDKSSQSASEQDLEEFRFKPNKQSVYPDLNNKDLPVQPEQDAPETDQAEQPPQQEEEPVTEIQPNTLAEHLPTPEKPGEDWQPIFSSHAGLFIFDKASERFLMQAEHVDIEIVEAGRFLCELKSLLFILTHVLFSDWLIVKNPEDGQLWLTQPIDSTMNSKNDLETGSFMWNYYNSGKTHTWLLRFYEIDEFVKFCERFAQHMWEHLNETKWEKAKDDEQKFVKQSHDQDVEMLVIEDEEEEEPEEEEEFDEQYQDEQDEEEAEKLIRGGAEEDSDNEEPISKDPNSLLSMGYTNDRSFVVRGNNIGVYKQGDDSVDFVGNIKDIARPNGQIFTPSQMMLHGQDRTMVMMDKSNKGALYNLDIETGKVVDEWKMNEGVNVNNFLPDAKFAQMTPNQTFIGTSHNAVFRVDPRLNGKEKMVDSQYKQYVSKNDFSAATTTASGKLAIASNKGDIRLFDQIGKNAKTQLPALGDPIIGIDVTSDGRWIIATCKTYLLLIDTLIGAGRYQGALGFDRSFPADAKPIPHRLQLKPEHVAYMDEEISFTPAKFNQGESIDETNIVTSTGPYVVTFNFKRIKQGKLDAYKIQRYDDKIVADQFKFGGDRKILAVQPHKVMQLDRRQLSRPSRQSISTPTKSLKSRSSIVDSRY
ncbi:cytoplasm protein [Wallemia mellicola]|nr:cytoplasm protein [Wallemia mellicola]TIC73659.1 cytoplasm protein [Wallemia mellicola]